MYELSYPCLGHQILCITIWKHWFTHHKYSLQNNLACDQFKHTHHKHVAPPRTSTYSQHMSKDCHECSYVGSESAAPVHTGTPLHLIAPDHAIDMHGLVAASPLRTIRCHDTLSPWNDAVTSLAEVIGMVNMHS